jgi:tetratricopeptide (TPR) repeat protein
MAALPKPPPPPSQAFSAEPSPQFVSGPAVEAATIASMQTDLERARGEYVLRRYEAAFRIVTELVAKLPAKLTKEEAPERVFLRASALCLLGRLHSVNDDQEQAKEAFTESVNLFESRKKEIKGEKTATRTRTDYGIALLRVGRTQDAIDLLTLVGKSGPTPAEAFGYLGLAYEKSGSMKEAESVFRKGLQLTPADPMLLKYLAKTLDHAGKEREAVPAYREAALAVAGLGDMKTAAQLANRALELAPTDTQALTTAIRIERERHDLPRCIELVNGVLQHDPRHAWALGIKGMLLRDSGDLNEAIKTLRSIDVQTPELAWVLVELADALNQLNSGHDIEALKLLDRASHLDPHSARADYVRAQIFLGKNQVPNAIKALKRAVEIEPQSAPLHAELGRVLFISGDFACAGEALDHALVLDPKSTLALTGKAAILRREGRLDQAFDLYRRVLRLEPDNEFAFQALVDVLLNQGRIEEALEELHGEIQRNPQSSWAQWRKGVILFEQKDLEGAARSFKTAVSLDPNNPSVVGDLAETLRGLDQYDEAGRAYDHLLQIQPESPYALGRKASYLSDIASFQEASHLLDRAIEKSSDEAWLWGTQGWCLENLGLPFMERARKAYEKALSLKKKGEDDLWERKGLANTLCQLGLEDEAKRHLEKIIEKQKYETGNDAIILAALGWCHYQLRRYDEAVRLLHASLSVDEDPSAVFDLGLVLLASSRAALAASEYQRALDLTSKRHALRQRGLYYIALFDLVEGARRHSSGPEADNIFELLRGRLMQSGVNTAQLSSWLGDKLRRKETLAKAR